MAGGSETIREFLVALGFKMDEPALKKFTGGIDKATKAVFTLAAAVEATALTIAYGVTKFAANMEDLYFAAKRTGGTVRELKALDISAQNFGASAGEAVQSLENMAELLRENPGNVGLLKGWGVQVKYLKDGTIDAQDAFKQLFRVFKGQDYYVAKQMAGLLGISDHTLQYMRAGGSFEDLTRVTKEIPAGFEKAAEDANKFMKSMRDLEVVIEAFGARVLDALQNKLGVSIKDLKDYLEAHGDEIATRMIAAVETLWNWANRIKDAIVVLVGWLERLDTATDGWSTKLLAIGYLLKVSGAGSIISGTLQLAAAFFRLGAGMFTASGAALALRGGLLGLIAVGAFELGKHVINPLLDKAAQKLSGTNDTTFGGELYELMHRGDTAMRFFKDHGWSDAQSAGIVARLQRESGTWMLNEPGDGGHAQGIGQWHEDRQANFLARYGKQLKDASFLEQLDFANFELTQGSEQAAGRKLRATRTYGDAGEAVSRYWSRPADMEGEAARTRADAERIGNNTTIHVNGTGDPQQVAARVQRAQERTSASMLRNAVAPVQ